MPLMNQSVAVMIFNAICTIWQYYKSGRVAEESKQRVAAMFEFLEKAGFPPGEIFDKPLEEFPPERFEALLLVIRDAVADWDLLYQVKLTEGTL